MQFCTMNQHCTNWQESQHALQLLERLHKPPQQPAACLGKRLCHKP